MDMLLYNGRIYTLVGDSTLARVYFWDCAETYCDTDYSFLTIYPPDTPYPPPYATGFGNTVHLLVYNNKVYAVISAPFYGPDGEGAVYLFSFRIINGKKQ